MRWLIEVWRRLQARRRARDDFARIRVELEAIERKVLDEPWWGDLPAEYRHRP